MTSREELERAIDMAISKLNKEGGRIEVGGVTLVANKPPKATGRQRAAGNRVFRVVKDGKVFAEHENPFFFTLKAKEAAGVYCNDDKED